MIEKWIEFEVHTHINKYSMHSDANDILFKAFGALLSSWATNEQFYIYIQMMQKKGAFKR